jgi:NAD(P)H-dependent FMN reductase
MARLRIAIILGSTRPNRRGEAVAQWVHGIAKQRTGTDYDYIDLRDVGLPLLDEPHSPAMGNYAHEHTKRWSAQIEPCDGFVFVSPEYNHSTCAALKNALDFLYREWNGKAAGFVAYGNVGGARAIEHLRGVCGELQIATIRQTVTLVLATEWQDGQFTPAARHEKNLNTLLDQLDGWAGALKPLRG